jgi:rhombotail lipoprotein
MGGMVYFCSPLSRCTRLVLVAVALFSTVFLSGCASWYNRGRTHEAGSVVQFLYPDQKQPLIEPSIPTLRLPLRVGVAFVPSGSHANQRYASTNNFTEAQKTLLLRQVAEKFKALPFIHSIEIVPTTYLRPGGGFDNLEQLRAIMGIDVIALVAYDQAQNSSETAWSLAYWTIVGAYIVPAQQNETHTLVEAVVYDIASRSLLFRAPGTSAVKAHSTIIRTEAELRIDSARGFTEASADMTKNLQVELEAFKIRAKEEPQKIRIEHKPGYSGAGSLEGGFALGLVLLLATRRLFSRR